MTTKTLASDARSIAPEVRRLLRTCRGPGTMKARLCAWADLIDRESAEAWRSPALNAAGEALVVLSFASAAFRLAPEPCDRGGNAEILAADLGGYLAAVELIKLIIATAPAGPTVRASLVNHVSDVFDRLTDQLQNLLTRG